MAIREGRFEEPLLNETFSKINSSIGFDKRLYREDIRGSVAYAKALFKREILGEDEKKRHNQGTQID